jgi:hypothetical protein
MKNRYTWSQVAEIYNRELGIDYPFMEDYIKGKYSDLNINKHMEHESNIKKLTKTTQNNAKSEYFPELYI